jgi:small subunit ribosomal protein S2
MPEIPSLVDLLKTGAHFGHQVSKWHPKMKPFLFGSRNGIHIINLEQTTVKLKETLDATRDIVAKGGTIVFIGTKRQARGLVEKYAKECKMPYVIERWLGGTFTNFPEINRLIRKLNDYRAKRDKGEFDKYTKKERVMIDREIADMERKVGGISTLTRLPEAVYIVDIKHEKTALMEANEKKVPVIAMTDSNVNPEDVTHGVPMNDDAIKAIELMTRLMAEAVNEGLALRETLKAEKAAAAVKAAEPAEKERVITA